MAAKMSNRDPRDESLKSFRLFDDDETGKISFRNLKRVAKELGAPPASGGEFETTRRARARSPTPPPPQVRT